VHGTRAFDADAHTAAVRVLPQPRWEQWVGREGAGGWGGRGAGTLVGRTLRHGGHEQ
jgi:hypothetical protein